MLYCMALYDATDPITHHSVEQGELITYKARITMYRNIPDEIFDMVAVSKSQTYTNGGSRYVKHGVHVKVGKHP